MDRILNTVNTPPSSTITIKTSMIIIITHVHKLNIIYFIHFLYFSLLFLVSKKKLRMDGNSETRCVMETYYWQGSKAISKTETKKWGRLLFWKNVRSARVLLSAKMQSGRSRGRACMVKLVRKRDWKRSGAIRFHAAPGSNIVLDLDVWGWHPAQHETCK